MAAAEEEEEEDDFKAERLPGGRRRLRRVAGKRRQAAAEEGGGGGEGRQGAAAASSSSSRPPPEPPPRDAGPVRCQLCGEDLSGLDAAGRQRHANRCLDDLERLPPPSTGHGAAECPLCGKAFSTPESRGSHLKRCAARMALPPPLLLQVVRQQSSSALPASLSGLKRKVSSCPEQSTKKRKTGARTGVAEEELQVAMAMSRSLQEEEEAKVRWLAICGRENRAGQGRKNPRGEKKNRAVPPHSAPTLLLQDPEKVRRQTEERVALLLSEADNFPSTPPLPPSRTSELSRKADWPVASPKGPLSSLWERSSLVGLPGPGPICVAGSALPALAWQADQSPMQSTALPPLHSDRAEAEEVPLQERGNVKDLQGKSPREEGEDAEGCSQKEEGALQDLMELAGEGMTLTQWNPAVQPAEEPGQEWMPGDVPRSDLDQSHEKKLPSGSHSPPVLLGLLAAAFKGMVNNPHLSDVQFQVDSGELFYAHMFVLYARCPQLMELVDQEGFWVAEEGEAKTRRVLLRDTSGEAAGLFLNYLYTAEHFVPQDLLQDVAALAMRFGVAELAALCTSHGWSGQPAIGASGQEEEGRVEKFEELLKSIWVGEEEEDKALLPEELGSENVVDEQELEEIYEFAATQRKAKEERGSRERSRGAEVGACPMEEAAAAPGDSSGGRGSLGLEPSCPQVQDAETEIVSGFPLEPSQDAEEQRPLGAASRRHLEAPPELAEASREFGEKSLLAVSWGESLELFQQSYSVGEPGDQAAGEEVAAVKTSTPLGPEKGLVLFPRNFSSGGSRGPLEVLADELPTPPKRREGSGSDLSLTLFSPALQEASEKPHQIKERGLPKRQREASTGTVASRDVGNVKRVPAPLPSSPSPVDPKRGTVLVLAPEDEGMLGQGKQQVEKVGSPYKEQEAFGTMNSPLSLEVGITCCQGSRAPLLETLPDGEPDTGGERICAPGPQLNYRVPNNGQVGLTSRPEAHQSGDTQDGHPESAVIPSPKRQSLQGCLPLGHSSPSAWSSASQPRIGKPAADVVVILDDSEEEAEAAPERSWGSSVFEVDLPVSEDDSGRLSNMASPEGPVVPKAGRVPRVSPARPLARRNGAPPEGSLTTASKPLPSFEWAGEESCSQRLDSEGQDDEMEILPLTQRLPAPVPSPKTPVLACQEREAPCTTPPTPMPSYSIMETPVLKKELSRFGVRTLPKRRMVLKLKEIFQYTHRRPDSRDAAAHSQPTLSHRTETARRRPTSAAACSGFPKQPSSCPELPQVLLDEGRFGGSSGAGDRGQMAKKGSLPAGSGRRKRAAEGPVRGGRALAASQKADGLSGATGDTSDILQSSSTELESSVLTEEDDDLPASQSTGREANAASALRQYIRSRPSLWRQILSYQPFELAKLQAELKQNGIRIALGRLLEFLDAHCITFTTAEARREKRQQSGSQGGRRGKRKRY